MLSLQRGDTLTAVTLATLVGVSYVARGSLAKSGGRRGKSRSRDTHGRPKIFLVGGWGKKQDVLANKIEKLGVEVVGAWSGDRHTMEGGSVPKNVDLVLGISDLMSRSLHNGVAKSAKSRGVPYVVSTKDLDSLRKALTSAGVISGA